MTEGNLMRGNWKDRTLLSLSHVFIHQEEENFHFQGLLLPWKGPTAELAGGFHSAVCSVGRME